MPAKTFVQVLFQLDGIKPDPTPFKVYSPSLHPARNDVFVEVQLPDNPKYVIRSEEKIILTPTGLAKCLSILTSAMSSIYNNEEFN